MNKPIRNKITNDKDLFWGMMTVVAAIVLSVSNQLFFDDLSGSTGQTIVTISLSALLFIQIYFSYRYWKRRIKND